MKKLLCIALVAVFCFCTPVYALEIDPIVETNPVNENYMWVERLFEHDYVFIDYDGNDITADFYQSTTPAYNMGDYETVAEYYISNVDYGEYEEVEPYSVDGNVVVVTKIRSDNIEVDDLEHGFTRHNVFYYDARLRYRYDAEENVIVSGYDPEVYRYGLAYSFSIDDPYVSVFDESYVVAEDGSEIQYEFCFEGAIVVNTGGADPDVDYVGIAYSYEGTVDIFLSAGP